MSQGSSVKGKGNANKTTKYASFNLSQTYVGTKPETKTSTGQNRHGMQVLGRVSKKVLAPAHLPSIRKENKGNDPSVSIVTSNSGWASKKEKKEQTAKQEEQVIQEQGPTSQKQTKQVGQSQDISLRPNAGAGPKQGDGTKTWVSLQTSTGSTSQPTTTYFQKEFPKLGGEGEGGLATNGKEPQEEKAVQQTRPAPPRFQSDQKFTDGPGGPMMPRPPMAFPPDQRQMFNGGSALFNRPVLDAPYGMAPMPPAMFGHGFMMPMAGRFPYPFDPNYARGIPGGQRMPVMPQKPPVAQGDRPLTVRDEDLRKLGKGDDDDGDGWAGDQEEVDYNAQLKFDDSDLEEDSSSKNEKSARSSDQSSDFGVKRNESGGRGTPETGKSRMSKAHTEDRAGKADKGSSQKDEDTQGPPPPTQAWADMPQGFPGQVQGAPFNQGQWNRGYPPPPFDPSRMPPNYPYGLSQWFYAMAQNYQMGLPQQPPPGTAPPHQQGVAQQHPPVSVATPPPHTQAKASVPQAGTTGQDVNEGPRDSSGSKFSSNKSQPKRKEPESQMIQEARRRKQEEEIRLDAERKAAAQAKLKNLEAKMGLKTEKSSTSGDDKRNSESDATDHTSSSVKDRGDLREEDSKTLRDRRDSEASDASRTSSQARPERSYSKKEVAPRFLKQQHKVHRTSSDEYPGIVGDENDYLNLPQAEGRASPAMSQSSDTYPVRRIMKRHDSARSDDASSVHSQDSWGMGPGTLREGVQEGTTGEARSGDLTRQNKGSYNGETKNASAHVLSSETGPENGDKSRERKIVETSSDDNRRQNYRVGSSESSDSTLKHHSYTSMKSNETAVLSELDSNKMVPSGIQNLDSGKGHSSDIDAKKFDAKRHRDQKMPRSQENVEYSKGDKYDRNAEKRNFKKLEEPSLKNNKASGSKERLGKSEKDQVKRTSQLGEPKRASAWAKVVAGEVPSSASGTTNEDKNEREMQKNLNDIQKEQEENERKELEKEKKAAESQRDTGDDSKYDSNHRDAPRMSRGEAGGYVERRDSDRRKKTDRDDRNEKEGFRSERRGYGPRNDDEKGGSHPRDRPSGRSHRNQEQKPDDSDEFDDQQNSKRNSAYDSSKSRRSDRERLRGPRVQDKSRSKPARGDKDERDHDRPRDKIRDDSNRNDGGARAENSAETKEGDRREKYRDRGRVKDYGNDRFGDDYQDSRRDRRYDGYKRTHEERKRKHDGGRADYKGYKDDNTRREYSDVVHRDDTRKDGRFVAQGEARDSRGNGSGQQGRSFGGRGYGNRDNTTHRGERYSERKGSSQKRRTGEDEALVDVIETNETKPISKDKKETRSKVNDEDVDEEAAEEENVDEGDEKSGNYSGAESDGEEGYSGSRSSRRIHDRGDEEKRGTHFQGSKDRRGQFRTVSRAYSIGKTSHRGFSRQPRSGLKDGQGLRKRREDKAAEDRDNDYGQSDEDGSTDEDIPREGDEKDERTNNYDKNAIKSRSRVERETYRRPSRGSRGMQERRWEKDQPPRFKKQHALLNKGAGRGRDFTRGTGRGRAYPSHSGVGRERNRGRGHSQGGASYAPRQQEEDWENDSGGSGTYLTAEETSVSTGNQETHRKSTYSRGKGYSRGHGQRGGQGSHSTAQEDRSNHFLADRQQVRVSQVGTSAQASALPAAFGSMQALKDSEVRSSNTRMPLTGKKSEKAERASQNGFNVVSSLQSRDDVLADSTDEPPKKIPKNKSSMEIKRDFLKEFDLSNIASVVVIDDFGPASEPGSTVPNDDDGFVQVTSRKTQKELREKQREEVRKKQREEISQGSKSHKGGDKENSLAKAGRQHKTSEVQGNRIQTPSTTPVTSSSTQVVTSTQAQTSNAAMAAVGGWEPAQSLMRTSQVVSNGTGLEVGKSMTVPAPPPRVNAWQRPLNFTSSVGSGSGPLSQSKTPDPKAVGTGKPSSSSKQVTVNSVGGHSVTPSTKPPLSTNVAPAVSQAASQSQPSADRKADESVDAISAKKTESKKEKSGTGPLKSVSNVHASKKIMSRGSVLRDKPERNGRDSKGFTSRQPLVRRDKLIDRKTKREKPPRFRNISKGRMSSGKDSIEEDAEVEVERAPISPLAEAVDKLVTGGSKLQGEDRAPGKRPQSFEGRSQIQSDLTSNPSVVLPTSVTPNAVSTTTVGAETMAMVPRSIPVQLAVTNNVVERSDKQLSSSALRKQPKDDGSSAEEEENAKDTARSVIKSLSDDDEKTLETRSLPGTPPLAVEIPEPNTNGPSSDPGRTTSPAAPNSMAQEMNEMSKKVLFTKKLWDDVVSGSSVGLVGVQQNTTLTTWSDGSETSQKVIKEITVVSSEASVSDAAPEKQIEVKDESSPSAVKPEEKVSPVVTNPSAFTKKTEQQNVCKVKPQQQQQIQPTEAVSSETRGSNVPSHNQVMTSQFLIPSPYTVPCQPATSQTAKVHQGYLLPVENLNAGLQQAFLAQGDSPNFQELSQQQPISLNIHTVNQPSARSTSAIAQQQQQQQQEFMRPLVVNNLYGPPAVQGGQSQLLTWQVVTTHSAHTTSSVSFQSHLQGSHSGNAFNQNVTLTNTPLFMTFDPQGAATNSSIFSTQRASSHLQQQPVGLVVQQPQSQTLPSYVGVIPGNHQSSHDHPFSLRNQHAKVAVGSSPLPAGQLHHTSSPLPLGSATLARHQQLEGSDGPVHHLSSISSVSGHHPVGQRSSSQVSPGMSVLTQGMTGPVSSLHLGHGQSLNADGHMSSQSELMKHVNAKPFQPSSKTPPSVGIAGQPSPGLSHVSMRTHTRSTQNPLVAPVRPRPVQGRSISSSPTAVALQNASRLSGAVSPVDQYAAYIPSIPSALQVKGQHMSTLPQHSLQSSNVQHPLHALQGQFPDQGQIVGPSRAFSIHPNSNPVPRFARPAPGPIQRPSPVNVVNAVVPPRPKVVPHHPQPMPNKGGLAVQQPTKSEHFQLNAPQPQEMFRSQQHQKMIEETKKFFQKETRSQGGKPQEKSSDEDLNPSEGQDESMKFQGANQHDVTLDVGKEGNLRASTAVSCGPIPSVPSVKSTVSMAAPLGPPILNSGGNNLSLSDANDIAKDDNLSMAKPQPQRPQERARRAQRSGKIN